MHINKLVLKNFRNISKVELKFGPKINIIIAPNGTGKTNILEGIYLACLGKSPKTSTDSELIPLDVDKTKVDTFFTSVAGFFDEKINPHEAIISFAGQNGYTKKVLKRNQKNTTQKFFERDNSAIFFSPESIGFFTNNYIDRRKFFDNILSIIDIEYSDFLTKYNKALRNRNIILKKLQKNGNKDELLFWTREIIDNGSKIVLKRWELLSEINPFLITSSMKLSKDTEFLLEYSPHIDSNPLETSSEIRKTFLAELDRIKMQEIFAGKTLKGPHRDKWILTRNGQDVSRFGSRGEQRIGLLTVFFAFHSLINNVNNINSILLLDDITSELDEEHINLFKDTISETNCQTVITTTQEDILKTFQDLDSCNIIRLSDEL